MKRKLIYGILAILISFGMWLYVVTVVNPEWEDTFYNIPVVLENEDILMERGLMMVAEEKPTVTLRLSGNRTDMIKLNASNITIKADLSRIYSAGEQSLGYSIIYPGDVPSNAFKIISQTPQYLTLEIVEWKSKEVDVLVEFNETTVANQYMPFKNEATLDYNKITVTGPVNVVDRITHAKVEVDLTNKTESISQQFNYVLCDENGNAVESDALKTNVEQIHYALKILKWKNVTLKVNVIDGGGIKKEDCTITQTVNTIPVAGSEKLLASLEDELLLDTINLGSLDKLTTEKWSKGYDVTLPEGLINVSDFEHIEVEIQLNNKEKFDMKDLNISVFEYENDEGLKVTLLTPTKIIKLRGLKDVVGNITENDVRVVVDLAGLGIGTEQPTAKVIISDEFAGRVGVVGICIVPVNIELING